MTPATQKGFSLIEMLVVLSIIGIVTSIALFGQSTFNRSILLTNTAYTVALSLREMQSLGLSSRKFGSIQNAGYGGRFTPATASSYILFADVSGSGPPSTCPVGTSGTPDEKPGNCLYNAGTDGIVQTYSFARGMGITRICGTAISNGARYCSHTDTTLTALDVVYVRSNITDTVITGQRGGVSVPMSKGEIYVTSPEGDMRGICVSQVGEVSVSIGDCP